MEKAGNILGTIAALAALGVGIFSCGGDDSTRTETSTPSSRTAPADGSGDTPGEEPAAGAPAGGEGPEGAGTASPPPAAESAAARDSGGGSDQFRVPEGDNSIQTFGEEASDSERRAAAVVLHAFLLAQANEQWSAACSYLSEDVLEQLRLLATRMEDGAGQDCPETLAKLTPPFSSAARKELIEADVGSLRIEGERAFVLYHGAGDTTYAITMTKEAGDWKVASLSPVPIS